MPRRKTDATETETISEISPAIKAKTKSPKPDFQIKITATFWKSILEGFVLGEGFLQVTRAGLRLIHLEEDHILTENIFISSQCTEIIGYEMIADSYNVYLDFGNMFAELKKDTYKGDYFTLIYFIGQDLQVEQNDNTATFRIQEKEDRSPFIIQLWKDYVEDLLGKKSINYFKIESLELGSITKMFDAYGSDVASISISDQGVEIYDENEGESQNILYKYIPEFVDLFREFTPVSKALRLEQLKLMQQKGLIAISRYLANRQAGKYHENPYSPEDLERAKKGFIQELKEILQQFSKYFVKCRYSIAFLKLIAKSIGKLATDFPTFYLLWNFNLFVRFPIAPESEVQMILAPRGWDDDDFYVESALVSEILEHLKSSVKNASSDKQSSMKKSSDGSELASAETKAALTEFKTIYSKILSKEGINGIGIGLINSKECILITLEEEIPALNLPSFFKGFPIKIEVKGKIHPLSEKGISWTSLDFYR